MTAATQDDAPTFDGDSFDDFLREASRLSIASGIPVRCPRGGDIIAGKYRVEHMLGRGGMGAVFEVTHVEIGKRLALKWMLSGALCGKDAKQRLLREARAASRVNHPAVVQVHDVGEDGEVPFLVMELLQGQSLAARMESGPQPLHEVCEIMTEVLRAIVHLHQAGVVHRDLKPDNIFLLASDQGAVRVKILDFGISKVQSGSLTVTTTITKQGAIVGTPAFMAPEQLSGRSVDERADIYSLGVVLFVALTGKLPFVASSFPDLVRQVISTEPPRVTATRPELPKAIDAVVHKAMARNATDRFADARAFEQALAAAARPALLQLRGRGLILVLIALCAAIAAVMWLAG